MAQADRIVGEIALFTVGSYQLAAILREGTLELGMRTVDNTAINDAAEYPIGIRKYGTITATCVPEVASEAACQLISETGQAAFQIKPTAKTGGGTFSGNCIVTRFVYNASDAPTMTLEGQLQGPWTYTAGGGG
jgi:hypothetical protein